MLTDTTPEDKNKRVTKKRTRSDGPVNPFTKLRRRRYQVQTPELTARVLLETWGNLYATARILGITRQAVEQFIKAHADVLQPILQLARAQTIDLAEWQLKDALFEREPWAVKLVLETLGKERGYRREMQIGGPPNPDGSLGPVRVQILLPHNGRNDPPATAVADVPQAIGDAMDAADFVSTDPDPLA